LYIFFTLVEYTILGWNSCLLKLMGHDSRSRNNLEQYSHSFDGPKTCGELDLKISEAGSLW
jgi:hypothetical protein